MQYSNMFFKFDFQLSLQATSRNPVPSQTQRRFLTPALVAEVAEAARAQYEAQAQAIQQQVCNYRIICLGLLTVTHASFL